MPRDHVEWHQILPISPAVTGGACVLQHCMMYVAWRPPGIRELYLTRELKLSRIAMSIDDTIELMHNLPYATPRRLKISVIFRFVSALRLENRRQPKCWRSRSHSSMEYPCQSGSSDFCFINGSIKWVIIHTIRHPAIYSNAPLYASSL